MSERNLRCGLIGLGSFGKHYLRLLQKVSGVSLSIVANRTHEPFDAHKELLTGIKTTTNTAEIFDDPLIDAVFIVTPPRTHFVFIETALKAGKHVFVEKPAALSLTDAKKIATLVKKSDRIFMVGHQYPHNDYIRHLKTKIREGSLGTIHSFVAETLLPGPNRFDIDALWEIATHELSIIDYLLEPAKLTAISVNTKTFDTFSGTLTFDRSLETSITVSWNAPEKIRRFFVVGTQGAAFFDDTLAKDKLKYIFKKFAPTELRKLGSKEIVNIFLNSKNEITVPDIRAGEPLQNEVEYFFSCVKNNTEPVTGISHALRITDWLEQISKS